MKKLLRKIKEFRFVQYKVYGQDIHIDGTNSWQDVIVDAFSWIPLFTLLFVTRPYREIVKEIDTSKPVTLYLHSIGNAWGNWIAFLLFMRYKTVGHIESGGGVTSLPFFIVNHMIKNKWTGKYIINGNDPIPLFWPHFKRFGEVVYIGDKRTPLNTIKQFFHLRTGDHIGYWS